MHTSKEESSGDDEAAASDAVTVKKAKKSDVATKLQPMSANSLIAQNFHYFPGKWLANGQERASKVECDAEANLHTQTNIRLSGCASRYLQAVAPSRRIQKGATPKLVPNWQQGLTPWSTYRTSICARIPLSYLSHAGAVQAAHRVPENPHAQHGDYHGFRVVHKEGHEDSA